jgi:hypothetical protein
MLIIPDRGKGSNEAVPSPLKREKSSAVGVTAEGSKWSGYLRHTPALLTALTATGEGRCARKPLAARPSQVITSMYSYAFFIEMSTSSLLALASQAQKTYNTQ